RRRQVDGDDALDQPREAPLLLLDAAQQALRHRRRRLPALGHGLRTVPQVVPRVRLRVLLLRVRLRQAGQGPDDRGRPPGPAQRGEVRQHVLLGVVHRLDGDEDEVRLVVEAGEVLGGVVARLVQAARVEERQQRRLGRGELVLAREARAGLEALADLGVVGAGHVLDDRRLAALRLAEQPEDRHRQLLAQLAEVLLQLLLALRGRKEALDALEHGTDSAQLRLVGRRYPNCTATRPIRIDTAHALSVPSRRFWERIISRKGFAMPRCFPIALLLLVGTAAPARADFLGWSYDWSASPTSIPMSAGGSLSLQTVRGSSSATTDNIIALGIFESQLPVGGPGVTA